MGEQPDHGPEWERTAREHEAAGRTAEAAESWAELARQYPAGVERAQALAEQARLLEPTEAEGTEADGADAGALYRRALANDPSNAAANKRTRPLRP